MQVVTFFIKSHGNDITIQCGFFASGFIRGYPICINNFFKSFKKLVLILCVVLDFAYN